MFRIRRHFNLLVALPVLTLLFTACSPGGVFSGDMMWAPHRTQETGSAVTQSAWTALSEGDRSGQITLSEAELSSLLRAGMVRGSEDEGLFRDVQVWLEPNTMYLKLLLRQGIVPFVPTDTALNVEASVSVEDGQLQVGLHRAGMGVIPLVSQPILSMIEEQLGLAVNEIINRSTPLDVTLDTGQITIDLP